MNTGKIRHGIWKAEVGPRIAAVNRPEDPSPVLRTPSPHRMGRGTGSGASPWVVWLAVLLALTCGSVSGQESLDGADSGAGSYIEIPDSASLNPERHFTIEASIKF